MDHITSQSRQSRNVQNGVYGSSSQNLVLYDSQQDGFFHRQKKDEQDEVVQMKVSETSFSDCPSVYELEETLVGNLNDDHRRPDPFVTGRF